MSQPLASRSLKDTRRHGRALAVSCLVVALYGCARRETPVDAGIRTQTLLVGNRAEPADLDPQTITTYTDDHIAYALFEGLTKLDGKTSAPVPDLATGWDVSGDGKTYTFHLRPEARWSDGTPVTAEDFVYSFHRILSPAFGSLYSYMLWPLVNAKAFNEGSVTDFSTVGAKALDAVTLQLTLERPTPYLPALASHNTWLPVQRATIEKFGRMDEKGTRWTRPGNLVGNGAFMLREWTPNARVVVVKNPLYWDAARTRLNRIEFYPLEKSEIEELNFRSGQLHTTYGLPMSKIATYQAHRPVDFRIDPVLADIFLVMNVTRPPLDNPKVRLALACGVDRDAVMRDVSYGVYPPIRSLSVPGCGDYTCRARIPDDFARARQLLAEAGYPGGRGLPSIEVQTGETEVELRMIEAIQSMWLKELGVHITIAQMETKTLYQNQQNKDYSIGISGWQADYVDPNTFLGTMVTGGGNNYAGWSNKEYDGLIAEAASTADNGRRLEIFQKAEAILLADAPIVPLHVLPNVYAINPAVRGWTTTVLGFHEWNRIWLEK